MKPQVVMVGHFPPPIGGAAKINEILFNSLANAGVSVGRINLAASGGGIAHRRTLSYHMQRLAGNLRGVATARRLRNTAATLYMVPDGGAGAWYSVAYLKAVSKGYGKVVLHHHTCRYVENRSRPIAIMTSTAREKTTHIFLTEGMAERYQANYGRVDYIVASNARFVSSEVSRPASHRAPGPLRLGHLSNLCRDKGFFVVADSFECIRKAGINARLLLAGPVIEPEVQSRLDQLCREYGGDVKHVGPISGSAKLDFYRTLDVFLFPTQFRQEAAPVVIYESLAAGVPVVTINRGLIAEIMRPPYGVVCDRHESYSDALLHFLQNFSLDESSHATRSAKLKELLARECENSVKQYRQVLSLLGAASDEDIGGT